MGLEAVVEAINKDSEQEADAILAEAKKKADALLAEAESAAKEKSRQAEARLNDQMTLDRQQSRAAAEVEARKEVLRARREVLDAAYGRVVQAVDDADAETQAAIVRKLFHDAPECLKEARRPGTKVFASTALQPVLAELGISSVDTTTRPKLKGLLIESMDGSQAIDMQFPVIIANLWAQKNQELDRLIFGEG